MSTPSALRSLLLALTTVLLAIGLAACSSDDDTPDGFLSACKSACPKAVECGQHETISACEETCDASLAMLQMFGAPDACWGAGAEFFNCGRRLSCEELQRVNREAPDNMCRAEQTAQQSA